MLGNKLGIICKEHSSQWKFRCGSIGDNDDGKRRLRAGC